MAALPESGGMAGLRDRLAGALREEHADPNWADHVTELLYDGESVVESIDAGDARVVVTSHRVLAFTPGGDGPAFRQVDRPNVVNVTAGARSEGGLLSRAARWGIIGLLLLGIGLVVDMDAFLGEVAIDGRAGSQIGVSGILGLVQSLLDLLRRLDEFLVIAGLLVLALAAVALGAYGLTREATVVIGVAGDDPDIHLPREAVDETTVARLEAAIAPAGPQA
jgi:hypothetical protein